MQVLWALLCKKKKLSEKDTDYTCRLSRGNMNEIENTFGSSHFEMCADFSKRLKASVRMEPPRARTRQNENLVQDGGGETENNHFVLSDDDDSDAEFVCNLLLTPTTITPSVSTTTTNTTTSTPSSSTSQKSNNQPEMLIRRRSPRTNNQSSSQNLQPSSLNFTNTNQEQSSTRKKRSSRSDTFMEKWSETEKKLKFSLYSQLFLIKFYAYYSHVVETLINYKNIQLLHITHVISSIFQAESNENIFKTQQPHLYKLTKDKGQYIMWEVELFEL